ncbi:SDR family oxidoreductase [Nocardia asteroides]|uniref:SDR family oxidoreductase n=1 Tax=Nocardia asteroides TaxID=1824 RepID=UPI0037CA9782
MASDISLDSTTAQKVVLITGASSGIGAATARRLAEDGHRVILTARRTDHLDVIVAELAALSLDAQARELDVTDRSAFSAVVDDIVASHGRLDVLVANAGVMLLSRLDSLLVDQWDQMFEVNVRGLYNGVAAVLPHFTFREQGHLVTIASIGAHQVVSTSAIYSATKYAAWALTEGLRQESIPGIRVTTISPGVVESELATHITDPYAAELMVAYRANAISPESIGRAVGFAIAQPADVDVNEIIIRPVGQR